jgi:hypothetical protein
LIGSVNTDLIRLHIVVIVIAAILIVTLAWCILGQ